jgi:hypothetical protein
MDISFPYHSKSPQANGSLVRTWVGWVTVCRKSLASVESPSEYHIFWCGWPWFSIHPQLWDPQRDTTMTMLWRPTIATWIPKSIWTPFLSAQFCPCLSSPPEACILGTDDSMGVPLKQSCLYSSHAQQQHAKSSNLRMRKWCKLKSPLAQSAGSGSGALHQLHSAKEKPECVWGFMWTFI